MSDWRSLLVDPRPNPVIRLLRIALRGLSLPYRTVMALRNWGFDRGFIRTARVRIPVISIGNLSVGGTGKTPTVAWLAAWFRERGVRVAIISRGYGRLENGSNDEALELELRLPDVPHLQNPDRAAAAQLAQDELEMELILLDDGFQHRRLARDLDIVLIDASDPPSAWHLLPGGLLREPFSALRRAQIVLLTRCDLAPTDRMAALRRRVERAAPRAVIATCSHRATNCRIYPEATLGLSELRGKKVLAMCGIGNPPAFFQSLTALGVELIDTRTWPDHHAFTAEDIASLTSWAAEHPQAEWMLCTMKDWVKLQVPRIGRTKLAALEIELVLDSHADEVTAALQPILELSQPQQH